MVLLFRMGKKESIIMFLLLLWLIHFLSNDHIMVYTNLFYS
jgi:hypothetical protein